MTTMLRCDCRILLDGIVYCPTHAQAHAMLALVDTLADLVEAFYGMDIDRAFRRGDATENERDAVKQARALLRAVEG
jgi:hypothetical protein